ncbi:B3 domain-containing protein REM16 [Trifolium pratense]|uniref:B3 domain-containing protein REM16 n=1 Tax=Trifolium pratense TaxID=57577 RepID=A0A2K3MYM2_TRIPR|nr:B3 domain-containing protein REM16 [Trifolium pratense]PNX95897.1 B3 domain-containing protein REM16 [Trifolium pratense]PNY13401.1 B3 domain-containing protein REM16 [Trifolium pratense]
MAVLNVVRLRNIGVSIRTPLAVSFETTNETTFNTGVESASPKHFMADAVAKTTPVVVPSQTTG